MVTGLSSSSLVAIRVQSTSSLPKNVTVILQEKRKKNNKPLRKEEYLLTRAKCDSYHL